VRRQVQAGQKVTVKLKLSRKARAAVKTALRRGSRIKAKVKVSARDSAGNTTTARPSIRRLLRCCPALGTQWVPNPGQRPKSRPETQTRPSRY
jgi:hypothetical protein